MHQDSPRSPKDPYAGMKHVSPQIAHPSLLGPSAPRYTGLSKHRILIGTPTLGLVRIEWHNATCGMVIPVNWGNSVTTPINFYVDDAQNLVAHEAIAKNFQWLLFIEDDVVPPPDLFQKIAIYMEEKKWPLVSGLYHLKSTVKEPFLFRGRGNGTFKKWKPGERVRVDGVPTGCLLIDVTILRALAEVSPTYELMCSGQKLNLKRIFQTPRIVYTDPTLPTYVKLVGTSDLYFCDRILKEGILAKAGWGKLARLKYPFLCDTSIRCGHIDRESGQVY